MLVDGKIPQGSECSFQDICSFKEFGVCKHTGKEHPSDFSCGTARGFMMLINPKNLVKRDWKSSKERDKTVIRIEPAK
jgi:hypothetical protein